VTLNEIGTLVLIALPTMVYLFLWTRHDLKIKRGHTLYDPKTGKKVSNFGDWLDGKEK